MYIPKVDFNTSKQSSNTIRNGAGSQCRTLRRSGVVWSCIPH